MDINNNAPSALDNFRYPLEQQLLEIMRSDLQSGDTLRGKCSPASNDCGLSGMSNRGMARRRGKSPFFTSSDQELLGGLDGSNQCKHLHLECSLAVCLRSNSLIGSLFLPEQPESPPSALVEKFLWAACRRTSTKKRSRPVSDGSERWQSTGRTRLKARYGLLSAAYNLDPIDEFYPLTFVFSLQSYFPPKGYAFLLFQDEASVQALVSFF